MTVADESLLVDRQSDPSSAVVRAALHLKGIGFRRTVATSRWLRRARRTVPGAVPPILQCGDRSLVGLAAILDWAETVAPEPALRPRDPAAHGYCRLLEQWATGVLAPAIDGVLWDDRDMAVRLAREASDDLTPGLLAPVTAWWVRWRRGCSCSEATQPLTEVVEVLESMLAARAYLLGGAFTAADLAVYAQVVRLDAVAARDGGSPIRSEAVRAWRQRLDAIDAIRSAVSP